MILVYTLYRPFCSADTSHHRLQILDNFDSKRTPHMFTPPECMISIDKKNFKKGKWWKSSDPAMKCYFLVFSFLFRLNWVDALYEIIKLHG